MAVAVAKAEMPCIAASGSSGDFERQRALFMSDTTESAASRRQLDHRTFLNPLSFVGDCVNKIHLHCRTDHSSRPKKQAEASRRRIRSRLYSESSGAAMRPADTDAWHGHA